MIKRGFTLIETMVYLGLFSIIITGSLISVFSILGSSGRNQIKAMVQEEGNFIAGKIDWALSGAKGAAAPTPDSLIVTRYNGPDIKIDIISGNIRLTKGTSSAKTLNNTNTVITNLIFLHKSDAGSGIKPESVDASFTISAKTPEGLQFSQKFFTLKYIRK